MITTEWACTNCGVVYDVESLPNETWRVLNLNPKLVVDFEGIVRPIDFDHADQLQAAMAPLCMNRECLSSEGGGYLSNEPIPIQISPLSEEEVSDE